LGDEKEMRIPVLVDTLRIYGMEDGDGKIQNMDGS